MRTWGGSAAINRLEPFSADWRSRKERWGPACLPDPIGCGSKCPYFESNPTETITPEIRLGAGLRKFFSASRTGDAPRLPGAWGRRVPTAERFPARFLPPPHSGRPKRPLPSSRAPHKSSFPEKRGMLRFRTFGLSRFTAPGGFARQDREGADGSADGPSTGGRTLCEGVPAAQEAAGPGCLAASGWFGRGSRDYPQRKARPQRPHLASLPLHSRLPPPFSSGESAGRRA